MDGYAKKGMNDFFLFKEFLSFMNQYVLGGVFTTNQRLLVLNNHGSHVTIEVVEEAHKFGLDMITLTMHTSYAPLSLDTSYFKPFKIAF
jgi:hypothetical protein